jgi:hypothetical protein
MLLVLASSELIPCFNLPISRRSQGFVTIMRDFNGRSIELRLAAEHSSSQTTGYFFQVAKTTRFVESS